MNDEELLGRNDARQEDGHCLAVLATGGADGNEGTELEQLVEFVAVLGRREEARQGMAKGQGVLHERAPVTRGRGARKGARVRGGRSIEDANVGVAAGDCDVGAAVFGADAYSDQWLGARLCAGRALGGEGAGVAHDGDAHGAAGDFDGARGGGGGDPDGRGFAVFGELRRNGQGAGTPGGGVVAAGDGVDVGLAAVVGRFPELGLVCGGDGVFAGGLEVVGLDVNGGGVVGCGSRIGR